MKLFFVYFVSKFLVYKVIENEAMKTLEIVLSGRKKKFHKEMELQIKR